MMLNNGSAMRCWGGNLERVEVQSSLVIVEFCSRAGDATCLLIVRLEACHRANNAAVDVWLDRPCSCLYCHWMGGATGPRMQICARLVRSTVHPECLIPEGRQTWVPPGLA